MTEPYPKYILRNIIISGTSVAGGGNLPTGGSTGQYLRKISSTDFDTEWGTLTVANVTDLTATATELNYTDGVTSAIQTQLDAKLGTSLTSANIIVGNGSNVATAVAMTGDIAITNTGVTSIGSGVIVNADVNASAAIAVSKLAAVTASRALVSDGSGFISAATTTATEIGYVNGVTSSIQTQLNAKLTNTLTSANVFVGNGSNVATGVAVTGDIGITNGGVTSITAGAIVNADVNASAAIAVSKLAAVTASRALASDGSGFITPSATTSTELGYVSGVTSAIQTQLDGFIVGQPVNALIQSPTSGEDGYAITWDDGAGEYTLTDPIIQGLTAGGDTGELLVKLSGTNYDADWRLLVQSDISDVTSTAAELNILTGATLTTTELNYVDGVTSNIQTQLDNKLSVSLAQHAVFVGNASNVAAAVAAGSSGQVFTIVGGVPSWATPSIGASGGAADEIQKNDGASGFAGSKVFSATDGSIVLGDSGLAGPLRSIGVEGSSADVALWISSSGTSELRMYNLTGGQVLFQSNNEIACESSGSLPFRIQRATSVTNTVSYVGSLTHITSGTPANGIGTGLEFTTETSAGNNEVGATIEAVTTDVTGGSEDFDLLFKTMAAGAAATEKLRITSDGAIQQSSNSVGANSLQGSANTIRVNTALTNVDTPILRVQHSTSGTPANGIGGSISFDIETSADNVETGVQLAAVTTDTTLGSEDFDLVFKTMTAGAAASEKLRIASTGVLTIPNASTNAAAASTGGLILHSRDSSDANSTLAIYAEQAPEATATFTQTHRFKIWINGVEYWLSLDAV